MFGIGLSARSAISDIKSCDSPKSKYLMPVLPMHTRKPTSSDYHAGGEGKGNDRGSNESVTNAQPIHSIPSLRTR